MLRRLYTYVKTVYKQRFQTPKRTTNTDLPASYTVTVEVQEKSKPFPPTPDNPAPPKTGECRQDLDVNTQNNREDYTLPDLPSKPGKCINISEHDLNLAEIFQLLEEENKLSTKEFQSAKINLIKKYIEQ